MNLLAYFFSDDLQSIKNCKTHTKFQLSHYLFREGAKIGIR
ncbi:MAG: hypothetical protein H6Q64_1504 [Firmicutes bacterium]|nr:hypothetical protein [Bacillota bacterium]